MSSYYKELTEARKFLDLPQEASLKEIKSKYRELLKKWHPDRCKENEEECQEMTRRIAAAYKLISTYIDRYKFSFKEEEVEKRLPPEELLREQFGNDHLWGQNKESKR
jgi:DnaJ-class molecular chaperone